METTLDNEFRNLMKKHRCVVQNYLNKFGLYIGQPRVLFYLEDNPGISQKELSEMLDISKEATSVSTRRLQKAGFLERNECQKDRRINLLSLSDQGLAIVKELRLNFDIINSFMFEELNLAETKELQRMLRIMNKSLEKRLMNEKNYLNILDLNY